MADPAAIDANAKRRIIDHMNHDHQDSLIRYLEHYCHLSSFTARKAKLTDMAFDHLVIFTDGVSHTVPIHPPMTSWSDARPRVVAMDTEAVAGLKRSNITVKRYDRPKGFHAVVFVVVILTVAIFWKESTLQSGSLLYDYVLRFTPGFAKWCVKIRPLILLFIVTIHTSETFYMGSSRLRRHTVPTFSLLWWQWMISALIEGFGSFSRFDKIVKEEEMKKLNAKH